MVLDVVPLSDGGFTNTAPHNLLGPQILHPGDVNGLIYEHRPDSLWPEEMLRPNKRLYVTERAQSLRICADLLRIDSES